MPTILIIEDDVAFCKMLERFLTKNKYKVETAYSGLEALKKIALNRFDLVLSDVRLPDADGLDLLVKIKKKSPETPVVMMTGYSEISKAVKAIKDGAYDYISKPLNQEEILLILDKALQTAGENKSLIIEKKQPSTQDSDLFVSQISEVSKRLYQHIAMVAPTDFSMLLTGESGTGKEVIAKAIHRQSRRASKSFVPVDCGAIPKEIAASEFFGHLKGSFTGAVNDKIGYFEAANNGTLFLDEIGNLSYDNQVQLLRALQERKIKPVGSNREIEVDIRLIVATNEDLREAVRQGTFREDLYHRLNEFSIHIPRLVERREDLMAFAEYFLEKANEQLQKEIIGFSPEVYNIFMAYHWPGNLRELQNVIKRAALLTQEDYIPKTVLPFEITEPQDDFHEITLTLKSTEKQQIVEVLKQVQFNKTKAAEILNISRKTLYNKLKKFGLE
ncbi:MAG: sigma-54 dependent transcriptional regulator [Flavobacteriaceae bacterium]|nr:sigma-54 dependent transcriptional regulator [Flavobacteriaceae bacterium]